MALNFRNPFYFTNRNNLQKRIINEFNKSFLWGSLGGSVLDDDNNTSRYIDSAYNINPDVFSVVNQIANKFTSVPYVIKKIEDKQADKKYRKLNESTKYSYSIPQEFKAIELKQKAYDDDYLDMPLEKPNPSQTWQEFWILSEIFLQTTGNVYWYMLKPEDGLNSGVPIAMYVLPSHLTEIVIKDKVELLSVESPIKEYLLNEGAQFTCFKAEDVIHIKYPNPNYDENGSHLYGQSRLRAGYKNIESTNKGLDLSVNTLKNGGAFGFLHAKDNQTPLTEDKAQAIKSRLKEMDNSVDDMGRIAGISASIGFTRISLTTDELKPFDYFKYNLKQVCNVLGWDDILLGNGDNAKYDNMKTAEKRVVMSKIVPDIKLFSQAFNEQFLILFKEYKNTCIDFMVKELPEMQQDYKTMVEWIEKAVNIGLITRNQGLKVMDMPMSEDPNMDIITVLNDIMTLEDAILPQDNLQI